MKPLATTRSRLGAAGKGSKPGAGTGFCPRDAGLVLKACSAVMVSPQ